MKSSSKIIGRALRAAEAGLACSQPVGTCAAFHSTHESGETPHGAVDAVHPFSFALIEHTHIGICPLSQITRADGTNHLKWAAYVECKTISMPNWEIDPDNSQSQPGCNAFENGVSRLGPCEKTAAADGLDYLLFVDPPAETDVAVEKGGN